MVRDWEPERDRGRGAAARARRRAPAAARARPAHRHRAHRRRRGRRRRARAAHAAPRAPRAARPVRGRRRCTRCSSACCCSARSWRSRPCARCSRRSAALPAVPSVYTRLSRRLEDPNASVYELSEMIAADTTLAVQVLRIANSAYFGRHQRVTRLESAAARLGTRLLRSLVLMAEVYGRFPVSPFIAERLEALQEHASLVARIASNLEPSAPWRDDAFTAGPAARHRQAAARLAPARRAHEHRARVRAHRRRAVRGRAAAAGHPPRHAGRVHARHVGPAQRRARRGARRTTRRCCTFPRSWMLCSAVTIADHLAHAVADPPSVHGHGSRDARVAGRGPALAAVERAGRRSVGRESAKRPERRASAPSPNGSAAPRVRPRRSALPDELPPEKALSLYCTLV